MRYILIVSKIKTKYNISEQLNHYLCSDNGQFRQIGQFRPIGADYQLVKHPNYPSSFNWPNWPNSPNSPNFPSWPNSPNSPNHPNSPNTKDYLHWLFFQLPPKFSQFFRFSQSVQFSEFSKSNELFSLVNLFLLSVAYPPPLLGNHFFYMEIHLLWCIQSCSFQLSDCFFLLQVKMFQICISFSVIKSNFTPDCQNICYQKHQNPN